MLYKTLIVDDESHALDTLRRYIEKVPSLVLTGEFENPLSALTALSGPQPPHIAFLDIDMPELNGITLAGLAGSQVEIIFTSAYDQFAMQAYDLQASGFLHKPFSFETFLKTVNKVCSRISPAVAGASIPVFFSVSGKRIERVMSGEILYVEAMLNYVKVYMKDNEKPKVFYLSLKKSIARFHGTHLIQASRSYIINTIYLDVVEGHTARMSNGKSIRIGPNYRSAFYDYLSGPGGEGN